MKRKVTIILSIILSLILFIFLFTPKAYAHNQTSIFDTTVQAEVEEYVEEGVLERWHLNYYKTSSYQTFFYKMVKFNSSSSGLTYFASLSEAQLTRLISWYSSSQDETWNYILSNLDIDPTQLEPDTYLGLYWDSYAYGNSNLAYLYLIWVSRYTPSEFVTMTSFIESNKVYNLYDTKQDEKNLNANWLDSSYYHIKDYNLTLHITPIAGIETSGNFGIELKQKYNFQGFTYSLDKGQFLTDPDPDSSLFGGSCKDEMIFDLGETPKNDGKNAMQLCTHAFSYITDCEAQSVYDPLFGGYKHLVHFNLSIDPDKVYRVDTKYTISNNNKSWYQFWLADNTHTILKSLTPDKSRGGILGLFNYQGFSEGSYASANNPSIVYKYELLLDYDDEAWRWKIFTGQEYKESDYKVIDEFQILRINYLIDNTTYDVPIKMDTIEGSTYSILSSDLIEDQTSSSYKVKTWTANAIDTVKSKVNDYKTWIYVAIGAAGTLAIVFIIIKIRMFFRTLLTKPRCDDYDHHNQ